MTECMLAHVLMPVCIHVLGQTELEERPGEQTEWVVFPNMGGVSALTLAQPYWVGGHYWLYLKPGFPFTHCRQSIKISPAGSFPKGGGPSLSREILHLRKNKSPGGAEVGFSHDWGLVPRVSGRKSAELSLGNPERETWTLRLPLMWGEVDQRTVRFSSGQVACRFLLWGQPCPPTAFPAPAPTLLCFLPQPLGTLSFPQAAWFSSHQK